MSDILAFRGFSEEVLKMMKEKELQEENLAKSQVFFQKIMDYFGESNVRKASKMAVDEFVKTKEFKSNLIEMDIYSSKEFIQSFYLGLRVENDGGKLNLDEYCHTAKRRFSEVLFSKMIIEPIIAGKDVKAVFDNVNEKTLSESFTQILSELKPSEVFKFVDCQTWTIGKNTKEYNVLQNEINIYKMCNNIHDFNKAYGHPFHNICFYCSKVENGEMKSKPFADKVWEIMTKQDINVERAKYVFEIMEQIKNPEIFKNLDESKLEKWDRKEFERVSELIFIFDDCKTQEDVEIKFQETEQKFLEMMKTPQVNKNQLKNNHKNKF